ncbi:MAG: type II toxin-antitoxin system prevent-host-death family antitoxin [Solirubrobacterales bacterium]|nr:type II toxin-antitoxin system prevent-host-death family antitoxin [Solirubrobacterales bacterium]
MTASEASRSFSAVLNRVESGETIVVTRGGKRVAVFAPALPANGGNLRDLLSRWHGDPALDEAFADRIAAARAASSPNLDIDPWPDPGA